MPERLAELGLLQALFDLRAVAVEVLDRCGRLPVDVGEDEAVAVDGVDLPVRASWSWSGLIVFRRREPLSLAISSAVNGTRRMISRSGSCFQPSGRQVVRRPARLACEARPASRPRRSGRAPSTSPGFGAPRR